MTSQIASEATSEAKFRLFLDIAYDVHVTVKKIESFKDLPPGWHFGDGIPITQATIEAAISLHQKALDAGFFETDASPGINGEVMVTVYHMTHYLEFILEADGDISFRQEEDREEVYYEEGLSFQDAKARLRELCKKWNGYESSRKTIIPGETRDLTLWRSSPALTPKSPSLTATVSSKLGQLYAPTSPSIIQQSRPILQFSGSS